MKHYLESVKDVLKETDSRTSGLDSAEAERRLAQYGRGRLLQAKKESLFSRFADQLTDPMVLVLVAAAVISSENGGAVRRIICRCIYNSFCSNSQCCSWSDSGKQGRNRR